MRGLRGGPDLTVIEQPVGASGDFGRRETPPDPAARACAVRMAVPVEMILYQVNATSQMFLRRWRQMGAEFEAVGHVWRVHERLVGQIDFKRPVGPEKQNGLVVQLSTVLWESLP